MAKVSEGASKGGGDKVDVERDGVESEGGKGVSGEGEGEVDVDPSGRRATSRSGSKPLDHLTPDGWAEIYDTASPRETIGALLKVIIELENMEWINEDEGGHMRDLILRANVHSLGVLAGALADLSANPSAIEDFVDTLRTVLEWRKLM